MNRINVFSIEYYCCLKELLFYLAMHLSDLSLSLSPTHHDKDIKKTQKRKSLKLEGGKFETWVNFDQIWFYLEKIEDIEAIKRKE